jgi:hypothetical protein
MAGSPDDASNDILTVTCAVQRTRARRPESDEIFEPERWIRRVGPAVRSEPGRAVEVLFGGDRSRRKRAVVYASTIRAVYSCALEPAS